MELNQFRDVDLVIDKANDNFIQRQFVSQGDYRGRTMTVQVTDNGLIGQVPGLTLNLRWRNQASGAADLSAFECIDVENSVFRIEYPVRMMTPGKVVANIQVIQNGQATHLKTFEMTVQALAGEMTGIVSQAEYGALVAILADANKFRTDIDSLGMDKADKTALAETDAKLNNLETEKANQNELDSTKNAVAQLSSLKVDKGGNEQITLPMLSQEVKTAMTGGSVAVVGENAINTSNVINNALTAQKVISPIQKASLIPSNVKLPDYDTTTKTLTFNGVEGAEDLLIWGEATETERYIIPPTTKVVNTSAGSSRLVFHKDTKVFRFGPWNQQLSRAELVLLEMRNNAVYVNAGFPLTVNSKETYMRNPTLEQVVPTVSEDQLVEFDRKKATVTFNGVNGFLFNVYGRFFNGVASGGGKTLAIPTMAEVASGALMLLFNTSTLEWRWIPYNQMILYKAETWAIIMTLRRTFNADGTLNTCEPSCPFVWSVDGKLFGRIALSSGSVQNPANAPILAVAHRGYNTPNFTPENVKYSFKQAKLNGFNAIECDVRFTSDGIPVILHDETINRTARNSDGSVITDTIAIADITLEQARQYDFGLAWGGTYAGEYIPTFDELVKWLKSWNMVGLCEIEFESISEDKARVLQAIVDKHNMRSKIKWISSGFATLTTMCGLAPDMDYVLIQNITDTSVANASTLKSQNNKVYLGSNISTLTSEGASLAKNAGLGIDCYTIYTDAELDKCLDLGVDIITTDNRSPAEYFLFSL